jgi:hypothetical protein
MGGYVCFPGGLMASLLGKPLVLVNADAALLMSQQGAAAGGRPRGLRLRRRDGPGRRSAAVVTGNPVRAEIEALPAPGQRFAGRSGPLRVLVVGGSLGAQVLNETVPAALALIDPARARRSRTRPATPTSTPCAPAYAQAGVAGRGAALHRRHGRAPGRLRPDALPRRRGHRERAVRGRRARGAGAADRQHHRAPARQRRLWLAGQARRCTCRRPS